MPFRASLIRVPCPGKGPPCIGSSAGNLPNASSLTSSVRSRTCNSHNFPQSCVVGSALMCFYPWVSLVSNWWSYSQDIVFFQHYAAATGCRSVSFTAKLQVVLQGRRFGGFPASRPHGSANQGNVYGVDSVSESVPYL